LKRKIKHETSKGWIGVEAIKAKLVPKAKPVLNKK
jgi:hypothetical protein